MIVLKLTIAEKDSIQGKEFAPDSYFNCVEDNNGDWVVSFEEMISLEGTEYAWLYDKAMKIHEPIPYNIPGI